MYKQILKPILFRFHPEQAHHITVRLLRVVTKLPIAKQLFESLYNSNSPSLARSVMGLAFKNPIGLAAGFDKDATMIQPLSSLGFGFVEVGTVTPKPQPGNPTPRLFRLPKDEALVNRMGFNNQGVDAMVNQLKKLKKTDVVIGGNIGKNKTTPNEQAIDDYVICFEKLFDYVDYFVVNVSSPNTKNLRDLQEKEPLFHLLSTLQALNLKKDQPKPILLKIAPDLNDEQLENVIDVIERTNLAGIIATNTTISREDLQTDKQVLEAIGNGGLSGKPLTIRATEFIRQLRIKLGQDRVIIGVGGIYDAKTAKEKLDAGADLIQVYSGLVYEGPELINKIKKGL